MSIMWMIYFADFMESFGTGCCIFSILFGFGGFISCFAYFDAYQKIPKILPIGLISASFFLAVIAGISPSKNTMYTMAAVKYSEELADKPEIKELGSKVYSILNQKLDELVSPPKKERK